jgi:hypothetical protein
MSLRGSVATVGCTYPRNLSASPGKIVAIGYYLGQFGLDTVEDDIHLLGIIYQNFLHSLLHRNLPP